MRWAHTCTQTHDRLPCWTCLCYCNHFVQSHWKRKNKNLLVSERFFMKSTGADCYILQRGAQLMFYGMTNAFSFLNVNTNEEKSINTLESFVVLFPEDSSRCFFVGERGGICTIPLTACNLETFKTVQGHRYVFFFLWRAADIRISPNPKKFSKHPRRDLGSTVGEWIQEREKQTKLPRMKVCLSQTACWWDLVVKKLRKQNLLLLF